MNHDLDARCDLVLDTVARHIARGAAVWRGTIYTLVPGVSDLTTIAIDRLVRAGRLVVDPDGRFTVA